MYSPRYSLASLFCTIVWCMPVSLAVRWEMLSATPSFHRFPNAELREVASYFCTVIVIGSGLYVRRHCNDSTQRILCRTSISGLICYGNLLASTSVSIVEEWLRGLSVGASTGAIYLIARITREEGTPFTLIGMMTGVLFCVIRLIASFVTETALPWPPSSGPIVLILAALAGVPYGLLIASVCGLLRVRLDTKKYLAAACLTYVVLVSADLSVSHVWNRLAWRWTDLMLAVISGLLPVMLAGRSVASVGHGIRKKGIPTGKRASRLDPLEWSRSSDARKRPFPAPRLPASQEESAVDVERLSGTG